LVGVKQCTPVIIDKCYSKVTRVGCTVQKCCKYERKGDIVSLIKCVDGQETCTGTGTSGSGGSNGSGLVPCSCPLKSCQCSSDVAIVCADGKNYQNECVAKCAGAVEILTGRCPFTPPIDPTTESNVCKNQFYSVTFDGKCTAAQDECKV